MVGDGNRQGLLGPVLADDGVVQVGDDLPGRRDDVGANPSGFEFSVMTQDTGGMTNVTSPIGGRPA